MSLTENRKQVFMPPKELWGYIVITLSVRLSPFVSGAYVLYYLRQESQIWCVDVSREGGV